MKFVTVLSLLAISLLIACKAKKTTRDENPAYTTTSTPTPSPMSTASSDTSSTPPEPIKVAPESGKKTPPNNIEFMVLKGESTIRKNNILSKTFAFLKNECRSSNVFRCLRIACDEAGGSFDETKKSCLCKNNKYFMSINHGICGDITLTASKSNAEIYQAIPSQIDGILKKTNILSNFNVTEFGTDYYYSVFPLSEGQIFAYKKKFPTNQFAILKTYQGYFRENIGFPTGNQKDVTANSVDFASMYLFGFDLDLYNIDLKLQPLNVRGSSLDRSLKMLTNENLEWTNSREVLALSGCATWCNITAHLYQDTKTIWKANKLYLFGRIAEMSITAYDRQTSSKALVKIWLHPDNSISHIIYAQNDQLIALAANGEVVDSMSNYYSNIKYPIKYQKTYEPLKDNPVIVVEPNFMLFADNNDGRDKELNLISSDTNNKSLNNYNLGWYAPEIFGVEYLYQQLPPWVEQGDYHFQHMIWLLQDTFSRPIVPMVSDTFGSLNKFDLVTEQLNKSRTIVFSMSYGDLMLPEAVETSAQYKNMKANPWGLFVVAAGNGGRNYSEGEYFGPLTGGHNLPNRIVVAAGDFRTGKFAISDSGENYADIADEGLATSLATPQTAATASRIVDFLPNVTASELKDIILLTSKVTLKTEDLGPNKKGIKNFFVPARSGAFTDRDSAIAYAQILASEGKPKSFDDLFEKLLKARKKQYLPYSLSRDQQIKLITEHLQWMKEHNAINPWP